MMHHTSSALQRWMFPPAQSVTQSNSWAERYCSVLYWCGIPLVHCCSPMQLYLTNTAHPLPPVLGHAPLHCHRSEAAHPQPPALLPPPAPQPTHPPGAQLLLLPPAAAEPPAGGSCHRLPAPQRCWGGGGCQSAAVGSSGAVGARGLCSSKQANHAALSLCGSFLSRLAGSLALLAGLCE